MRILLVAPLTAVALLAACGGSADGEAAAALRARLEGRHLSVREIACLDSGIRVAGAVSWRCTVDFGDPHLVPYCVVLSDGEAVTDREEPDLRCYPPEEEKRYRENALLGPVNSSP